MSLACVILTLGASVLFLVSHQLQHIYCNVVKNGGEYTSNEWKLKRVKK